MPWINVIQATVLVFVGARLPGVNQSEFERIHTTLCLTMNTPEQILHDRVNLVRLVRRLDKSINEADWGCEKSTTLWLRAEGLLQVRPFFSSLRLATHWASSI